jgi:hypothetical protein|tara:strand:+ start:34125 stop:34325 length:201 start_codon:yes stop_codon:yes gene_type:complete
MSLSEKESTDGEFNKIYFANDVKEFIKRLKDMLDSKGVPSQRLFAKVKYERFVLEKIDKLAGEKFK